MNAAKPTRCVTYLLQISRKQVRVRLFVNSTTPPSPKKFPPACSYQRLVVTQNTCMFLL